MSLLVVDQRTILIDPLPESVRSIDVHFDGHRVWSVDLTEVGRRGPLPWPDALHDFLVGSTRLLVTDTVTGETIAEGDVEFSPLDGRVQVTNEQGVWLAINKWGRLAPDLQALGARVARQILVQGHTLIGVLRDMGLRPFIVGGTLLGGVRDGNLLPHDDDADIAYLSEHTTPVDVALEGYRVGRRLEELGYSLMRHSATHMQLHFRDDSTGANYYIDVFAAFFTDDGCINQPFHVRGPMRNEQMLPFGSITMDGFEFPVPADLDHWLTLNYDEHWRIPNPGFALETPEDTQRRFLNWFGSFNFNRHFWNGWYSRAHRPHPWNAGGRWLRSRMDVLASPQLVDLGAGDGKLSSTFANEHREVIATDFARIPLKLARQRANDHRMRAHHLNLYRLTTLALPYDLGITTSFDVIANHVLDEVGHVARLNALRLIRMALRSGGSALATFHEAPSRDFDSSVPTTWHLTRSQLAGECARLGMTVEFFDIPAPAPGRRAPVGVRFSLSDRPVTYPEVLTMKQRIKRILNALDPRPTRRQVRELRNEVEALKSELDEYRAHSNRVAELLDIAEQRFTPNPNRDE